MHKFLRTWSVILAFFLSFVAMLFGFVMTFIGLSEGNNVHILQGVAVFLSGTLLFAEVVVE
jgi:hypothetical protein